MPNYFPQQHPYNYAQYTQPAYTPEFHAGPIPPNYQVPFPAHNGQPGAGLATPLSRPKHFSRNTNTTNDHLPYKSALKNGQATSVLRTENGIPVNVQVPRRRSTREREDSRGREGRNPDPTTQTLRPRNSSNSSRRPDRSISRQRTNSKIRFVPDHVFVSFKNDNELHVSNIVEHDSDKLSEAVLQMWPEGHDVMQREFKYSCTAETRIQVVGQVPWVTLDRKPYRVFWNRCETDHTQFIHHTCRPDFLRTSCQGFAYTTSTNSKRFPLRSMVFSRVPSDVYASQTTDFFVLSISSNRRNFTFIEPPDSIARNLAVDMNPYFPYQVASDRQPERGLLVLDVRGKAPGTPKLDIHIFLAWILHYIGKKGWTLNASIPLPRKRLSFRTGAKREVWIFRRKGALGI